MKASALRFKQLLDRYEAAIRDHAFRGSYEGHKRAEVEEEYHSAYKELMDYVEKHAHFTKG